MSLLDDLSAGGHAAAGEDAEHMQPDFADRDAVAYGEDLTTHLQFQAERLSLEPGCSAPCSPSSMRSMPTAICHRCLRARPGRAC